MTQAASGVVDIVLPAYNAAQTITRTLQSILAQTYPRWRCIVVDDGSSDATAAAVRKYVAMFGESRFVLIQNPENLGVANSLNIGIAHSILHPPETSSGLIARIDAGDEMVPSRLAKQVDFMMQHPNITVCGSNMSVYTPAGSTGGGAQRWRVMGTRLPVTHRDIRTSLPFTNPIAHPSVIIRKSCFDHASYESSFTASEDYRLWSLLSHDHTLANLEERLVRYFPTPYSETATKVGGQAWYRSVTEILGDLFDDWDLNVGASEWMEFYTTGQRNVDTLYCYQMMLEAHERLNLNPQLLYRMYFKV